MKNGSYHEHSTWKWQLRPLCRSVSLANSLSVSCLFVLQYFSTTVQVRSHEIPDMWFMVDFLSSHKLIIFREPWSITPQTMCKIAFIGYISITSRLVNTALFSFFSAPKKRAGMFSFFGHLFSFKPSLLVSTGKCY